MNKKYKIALNALALKKHSGGIESSYYNTVKYLLKNDTKNLYFLFIGKNAVNIFSDFKDCHNLKTVVLPIDTNNSKLRVIAEYTLLNLYILLYGINLVHHLCDYMPRINFCKTVTTIHDLSGFFYHNNFPPTKIMERYYRYTKSETASTLKLCDRIIAISNFTKSELNKYYPDISFDNKVVVIGQSLDSRKTDCAINETYLKELSIQKPYIFSASIVKPHKNYDFLIRAFNMLKEKYNIPHYLIIAGGMGNEMKQRESNSFLEEIEKSPYKEFIKYLGYVDNKYMATLYNFTDIYVTTTIYEGFGLPILEAMKYKRPIACSNIASLPEVGGEGCIYFDPYNVANASDVIYKLLNDKTLQQMLVSKQQAQLNLFSWDKLTPKILNVYNDVLMENKQI